MCLKFSSMFKILYLRLYPKYCPFNSMECSEWLSLILFDPAVIMHGTVITFVFMLSLADQKGRGCSVATIRRKCINFIANRWNRIDCFM